MINLLRGQMFQSEIGLEQGGASPLSGLLGSYAPMPERGMSPKLVE